MSIEDIKRSKKLKELKMSRKEISERALEIANFMVEHGGYKNAVACIGRFQILRQCINDCYWKEKLHRGLELEEDYLLQKIDSCKDFPIE